MQTSTTVKLDSSIKERVQHIADIRKRSLHSLMVEAIEKYVTREEQREELRQAGMAAHEHYMRTGLHRTQQEMEAWAAELAQGEKAPLPKCHV